MHARYHYYNEATGVPDMLSWLHQTDLLDDVLRRGYCDSPPFDIPSPSATSFSATGITTTSSNPVANSTATTPVAATSSSTATATAATMVLKNLSICSSYNYNTTYNPHYYKFEYVDWNEIYNQSDLFRLHRERRARLQSCSHLWPSATDEGALRPP